MIVSNSITTGTNPIALLGSNRRKRKMARGGRSFISQAGKLLGKGLKTGIGLYGMTRKFNNGGEIEETKMKRCNESKRLKRAMGGIMGMANPMYATGNQGTGIPNNPTYKKGGKIEADLVKKAKERGLHPKAALEMLNAHKEGGLTQNHIKKIASKYGHHEDREHHLFGNIVGWATKAWNKGKELYNKAKPYVEKGKKIAGEAHDAYKKHKDTIHKGIDTVAKVTKSEKLGNKAKELLNKGESHVENARKKHNFREGGAVVKIDLKKQRV